MNNSENTKNKTSLDLKEEGYILLENTDGNVIVFDKDGNFSQILNNKLSCESASYTFDSHSQKCKWVNNTTNRTNNCRFGNYILSEVVNNSLIVNEGTVTSNLLTRDCCLSIPDFKLPETTPGTPLSYLTDPNHQHELPTYTTSWEFVLYNTGQDSDTSNSESKCVAKLGTRNSGGPGGPGGPGGNELPTLCTNLEISLALMNGQDLPNSYFSSGREEMTQFCCEQYEKFNYVNGLLILESNPAFSTSLPVYVPTWAPLTTQFPGFPCITVLQEPTTVEPCPEFSLIVDSTIDNGYHPGPINETCCNSLPKFNYVGGLPITEDNINFDNSNSIPIYTFYWEETKLNPSCKVKQDNTVIIVEDPGNTDPGNTDPGNTDPGNTDPGPTPTPKCEFKPYKVIINSDGDMGSTFTEDINEICDLTISFDYIFKYDCEDLFKKLNINSNNITSENVNKIIKISDDNVKLLVLKNKVKELNLNTSYVIETSESKYKLTSKGLIEWEKILKGKYANWFKSDGSLLNYSDSNVETLINLNINGDLATESITSTIYDRKIAIKEIKNISNDVIQTTEDIKINTELIISDKISQKIATSGGCSTYSDIIESLDVNINLDVSENGNDSTIYTEKLHSIETLLTYVMNNSTNSGIIIDGNEKSCLLVKNELKNELIVDYTNTIGDPSTNENLDNILNNWTNSCWLSKTIKITDRAIISGIINNKVKLSLTVNNSCSNFSILLDRIKLNQSCEKVDNVETFISEPPKFTFTKVIDNKKSWTSIYGMDDDRRFDLKYRQSEYLSKDPRLVINTKELDLNLSPARALEQDLWCFVNDNPKLLSGNGDGENEIITCKLGFTKDLDGKSCTSYVSGNTQNSGTNVEIGDPYGLNVFKHNFVRGTTFISEPLNLLNLPIKWSNSKDGLWENNRFGVNYLTDNKGNYIESTGFGFKKTFDGEVLYSSNEAFSGPLSEFGNSSDVVVNGKLNPNILWGGTDGTSNTIISGRLMNAGIWVKNEGISDQYTENKWVGFSKCITTTETKIQSIGFGGTSDIIVKLNGVEIFNSESNSTTIETNDGFKVSTELSRSAQTYIVAPIVLGSGKNIFEVYGKKNNKLDPGAFVFEIYDATVNDLKVIRFEESLKLITLFSTKELIGTNFNYYGSEAFSCDAGFALDTCNSTPICVKIKKQIIDVSKFNKNCSDDNLIVKDFDGSFVSLPKTNNQNINLNITTLNNSYQLNGVNNLSTNEYELFSIGQTTQTSSNSTWLSISNDSSLSVHKVDWTLNNETIFNDLTNQLNKEFCEIIDNIFRNEETSNLQGVNELPNLSWDENNKKCKSKKCGDDLCINIDDLLLTELSSIDTVEELTHRFLTELIDVKNRKVIQSYPTLKMLYDRYDNHSKELTNKESSSFDYFDLDDFGNTIGDYWIGLIEQVIPSTSIWKSNYQYRNSIFDQQKFEYKQNNLQFCLEPKSFISENNNINVMVENLTNKELPNNCSGIWLRKNHNGSEFIGTVNTSDGNNTNNIITNS